MESIIIKGAREHNLKGVDVEIPKGKLVVFTGISGSGKSSLAFDTIYAEGQRRYVESLSSYARQFLGVMKKPDCDTIEGLSPSISIDQKSVSHNPRSTVGTITETYDYLRLLFARVGHPHCPNCGREITKMSLSQIAEEVLKKLKQSSRSRLLILSPLIRDRKGEYAKLFENLRQKGLSGVRIDGRIFGLSEDLVIIKTNKHTIEAVIDRLVWEKNFPRDKQKYNIFRNRLTESLEKALQMADGEVIVSEVGDASFSFPEKPEKMTDILFSEKAACFECGISFPELQPRSFSFNSPHGACLACTGLGVQLKVDPALVLNGELSIDEGGILPFSRMTTSDSWFRRLLESMAGEENISLGIPIRNLSEDSKTKLLYGIDDQIFTAKGTNRFGRMTSYDTKWEGIIKNLERRFKETDSDFMRQEIEKYMRFEPCPECKGARLKKESLAITIEEKNISRISALSIKEAASWVNNLAASAVLSDKELQIAGLILKEIANRLQFLLDVGLDYLTLDRPASTLAGGEAQRIRLASQIGSGLTGVIYVLDEPSIGLHQRDNKRLIGTLKKLRDLGNTVIVVEHDRELMENADWIIDFGPGAGERGGKIIAVGTPKEIKLNSSSLTGTYLSGRRVIKYGGNDISSYALPDKTILTVFGCRHHNLKNINISFPLGKLVCVTGVSGSGKSTLVNDILYHALMGKFYPFHREKPGEYDSLSGEENLNRAVLIDQSPIGRTPRSNPATYTGVFTYIRELFAKIPEAREKGYSAGRFSFNVKGGRCEACQGEGQIKIEMQFLPDVYIDCEICGGKRYNKEAREILYKGKNIAEVLILSVDEALDFFANIPRVRQKLEVLFEVGLGYIKLGQPATTLSGGEAQRVKLATELSKQSVKRTLYLLDEPTTGLHFADLEKLLFVLKRLVVKGNTVIVIEHNLDIIKNADWIIDLGPEGGEEGGYLVAEGLPSAVAKNKDSHTGRFLNEII